MHGSALPEQCVVSGARKSASPTSNGRVGDVLQVERLLRALLRRQQRCQQYLDMVGGWSRKHRLRKFPRTLRVRFMGPRSARETEEQRRARGSYVPKPKGVYTSTAALQPAALQDLVDVLPDVVKAAAGVPLQFQLQVTLGDGEEIASGKVEEINKLLESESPDLRVRP
jgi:hypothetical protein